MDNMELIAIGLSAALSLALEHMPHVSDRWHKLPKNDKRLVILILVAFVATSVNALACYTTVSQMPCMNWQIVFTSFLSFIGTHYIAKY